MIQRSTLLAITCLAAWGGSPAAVRAVAHSPTDLPVLATAQLAPAAAKIWPTLAQVPTKPAASTPTTAADLSNSEVLQLQLRLQQLGYYSQPVDGIYGPKTEQALSNFQQDSGLPATGNVDPFTVQRLQTPNLFSIESPSPAAESQIPNFLPSTASTPAAATPVPQAESEATAASTPTTEPVDTEPTAVSEFNPSQLLIPAILLLGLGAIGGGIVLVYRQSLRSGRPAKQLDKQAPAAHVTDQSALIADSAAAVNGSQQNLEIQDQTDSTAALEETTRLPKLNIVETLVAELQSSDPAKRRQAIWELGQRGNSSAVQPLVNLIMDADSKERSLILAALSEIGTHTLKPMNRALALSLQDDNPEVRKNAIRDLTRIYDAAAQVSQMLAHVAEDEDPEVRETARWALGQLNRIRPLPSSEQRASLYDSVSPADFLPGEKTNS